MKSLKVKYERRVIWSSLSNYVSSGVTLPCNAPAGFLPSPQKLKCLKKGKKKKKVDTIFAAHL